MNQDNAIYLVPVSLREANEFLEQHSRQYRPMRGCIFSVGCALDGKLVGAAIVGFCREDAQALQIDRIYTTGGRRFTSNICPASAEPPARRWVLQCGRSCRSPANASHPRQRRPPSWR